MFEAVGEALGDLVLRFSTTEIWASFRGPVSLSGVLLVDGERVDFAAEGTVSGDGCVQLATGDVAAWILIHMEGETDTGERVTIRGGLTVTDGAGDASGNALGSGSGRFDLRLVAPSFDLRARGDVQGEANGRFVVPADSLRMQLEGEAAFSMLGQLDATQPAGKSTASAHGEAEGSESLDIDTWPEHLADELRQALCGSALEEST